MTIVGTRPEVIRLSRVIPRLADCLDHVLVHTGQNHDHQLNQVFFDELGIPAPDHLLNVDTSSLGRVLGETLIKVEEVLHRERPDAVLVLGDTNSCIAAVMAKRLRIPVYHMEAGNRCFDDNVPEETNRRLVDHVADFNLVYTEHARRNLLAEGLHSRRILLTGSPMREVLDHYRERIDSSDVLSRLSLRAGEYFVVSAHREENVDSPDRLDRLLRCLEAVQTHWGIPIIVSTHPRTQKRLDALGVRASLPGVVFHEPFGFFDYNHLQLHARCSLSDSGTISEESAILGFPAVTLRESIERPEALDAGSIMMTGLDPENVRQAITSMCESNGVRSTPAGYEISDTSIRVVRFMLSSLKRHATWAGIRAPWDSGENTTTGSSSSAMRSRSESGREVQP
jgi:UDP-N-acetylglucosamine 2-epimerase